MKPPLWHVESVSSLLRTLGSDGESGLGADEARRRLARFGPNRLPEQAKRSSFALFLSQFSDFMVLVLLGAGIVSLALGEVADGVAIFAILLLNALFGFVQEYRAEQSLRALQRLSAPTARVVRDGLQLEIPAEQVVPGDVILVGAGDRIPADGRLIWSMSLEADESILTGESVPVAKDALHEGRVDEALADRRNMLFMGTAITRGRGRLLVTATGSDTEIGKIAEMMQDTGQQQTPLQQRLEQLGRRLVAVCFVLVGLVFAAGVLRGLPAYSMFLTGVSLAVAAIPEGLPAVVTAALAIGVQRMIRRKAIVRRLPAVETLGCVTTICTDKTGTLTKNEMTVTRMWLPGREIDVSGTGYEPQGRFTDSGRNVDPATDDTVRLMLEIAVLCNSASLTRAGTAGSSDGNRWQVVGDPTEGALLVLAAKGGLDERRLRRHLPTIHENPFDPARRRMSVLVRKGESIYAYVKGAPDAILENCTHFLGKDGPVPLSATMRRNIEAQVSRYAENALRVLALAYRPVQSVAGEPTDHERNLVFVGIVGLFDPPREDVARAIRRSRRAGVRTLMLTGDHPATAAAIGRLVGLMAERDGVLTGNAISMMTDDELQEKLRTVSCFARVSPSDKLRIVRCLKSAGELVAMTGDGVNDAPAVKEADIGISMGRTGSDVTKDASDMVLADDNYSTIIAAIEEGRAIYENIRKFIRYLLGCNAGEVLAMLVALLIGLPLPLLPLQILWMNLVTDGLPAIALGLDPADPGIMERGPRPVREGIFARNLWKRILLSGASIGGSTLLIFALSLWLRPGDEAWARTMAFTTLVMAQLLYAFQCRFEERTMSATGLLSNPYLVGAVLCSFLMQLAVIYWTPLTITFRTVPLTGLDWALILLASGWGYLAEWMLRFLRIRLLRRFAWVRVA